LPLPANVILVSFHRGFKSIDRISDSVFIPCARAANQGEDGGAGCWSCSKFTLGYRLDFWRSEAEARRSWRLGRVLLIMFMLIYGVLLRSPH
jgi:hypothetical protein